jgi:hypothetical protein
LRFDFAMASTVVWTTAKFIQGVGWVSIETGKKISDYANWEETENFIGWSATPEAGGPWEEMWYVQPGSEWMSSPQFEAVDGTKVRSPSSFDVYAECHPSVDADLLASSDRKMSQVKQHELNKVGGSLLRQGLPVYTKVFFFGIQNKTKDMGGGSVAKELVFAHGYGMRNFDFSFVSWMIPALRALVRNELDPSPRSFLPNTREYKWLLSIQKSKGYADPLMVELETRSVGVSVEATKKYQSDYTILYAMQYFSKAKGVGGNGNVGSGSLDNNGANVFPKSIASELRFVGYVPEEALSTIATYKMSNMLFDPKGKSKEKSNLLGIDLQHNVAVYHAGFNLDPAALLHDLDYADVGQKARLPPENEDGARKNWNGIFGKLMVIDSRNQIKNDYRFTAEDVLEMAMKSEEGKFVLQKKYPYVAGFAKTKYVTVSLINNNKIPGLFADEYSGGPRVEEENDFQFQRSDDDISTYPRNYISFPSKSQVLVHVVEAVAKPTEGWGSFFRRLWSAAKGAGEAMGSLGGSGESEPAELEIPRVFYVSDVFLFVRPGMHDVRTVLRPGLLSERLNEDQGANLIGGSQQSGSVRRACNIPDCVRCYNKEQIAVPKRLTNEELEKLSAGERFQRGIDEYVMTMFADSLRKEHAARQGRHMAEITDLTYSEVGGKYSRELAVINPKSCNSRDAARLVFASSSGKRNGHRCNLTEECAYDIIGAMANDLCYDMLCGHGEDCCQDFVSPSMMKKVVMGTTKKIKSSIQGAKKFKRGESVNLGGTGLAISRSTKSLQHELDKKTIKAQMLEKKHEEELKKLQERQARDQAKQKSRIDRLSGTIQNRTAPPPPGSTGTTPTPTATPTPTPTPTSTPTPTPPIGSVGTTSAPPSTSTLASRPTPPPKLKKQKKSSLSSGSSSSGSSDGGQQSTGAKARTAGYVPPHIKKSHEGSFTRWAKRHGMSMSEAIEKGKHSKDPRIRRKAVFADNARHWNHSHHNVQSKQDQGLSLLPIGPKQSGASGSEPKSPGDVEDNWKAKADIATLVELSEMLELVKLEMEAETSKTEIATKQIEDAIQFLTENLEYAQEETEEARKAYEAKKSEEERYEREASQTETLHRLKISSLKSELEETLVRLQGRVAYLEARIQQLREEKEQRRLINEAKRRRLQEELEKKKEAKGKQEESFRAMMEAMERQYERARQEAEMEAEKRRRELEQEEKRIQEILDNADSLSSQVSESMPSTPPPELPADILPFITLPTKKRVREEEEEEEKKEEEEEEKIEYRVLEEENEENEELKEELEKQKDIAEEEDPTEPLVVCSAEWSTGEYSRESIVTCSQKTSSDSKCDICETAYCARDLQSVVVMGDTKRVCLRHYEAIKSMYPKYKQGIIPIVFTARGVRDWHGKGLKERQQAREALLKAPEAKTKGKGKEKEKKKKPAAPKPSPPPVVPKKSTQKKSTKSGAGYNNRDAIRAMEYLSVSWIKSHFTKTKGTPRAFSIDHYPSGSPKNWTHQTKPGAKKGPSDDDLETMQKNLSWVSSRMGGFAPQDFRRFYSSVAIFCEYFKSYVSRVEDRLNAIQKDSRRSWDDVVDLNRDRVGLNYVLGVVNLLVIHLSRKDDNKFVSSREDDIETFIKTTGRTRWLNLTRALVEHVGATEAQKSFGDLMEAIYVMLKSKLLLVDLAPKLEALREGETSSQEADNDDKEDELIVELEAKVEEEIDAGSEEERIYETGSQASVEKKVEEDMEELDKQIEAIIEEEEEEEEAKEKSLFEAKPTSLTKPSIKIPKASYLTEGKKKKKDEKKKKTKMPSQSSSLSSQEMASLLKSIEKSIEESESKSEELVSPLGSSRSESSEIEEKEKKEEEEKEEEEEKGSESGESSGSSRSSGSSESSESDSDSSSVSEQSQTAQKTGTIVPSSFPFGRRPRGGTREGVSGAGNVGIRGKASVGDSFEKNDAKLIGHRITDRLNPHVSIERQIVSMTDEERGQLLQETKQELNHVRRKQSRLRQSGKAEIEEGTARLARINNAMDRGRMLISATENALEVSEAQRDNAAEELANIKQWHLKKQHEYEARIGMLEDRKRALEHHEYMRRNYYEDYENVGAKKPHPKYGLKGKKKHVRAGRVSSSRRNHLRKKLRTMLTKAQARIASRKFITSELVRLERRIGLISDAKALTEAIELYKLEESVSLAPNANFSLELEELERNKRNKETKLDALNYASSVSGKQGYFEKMKEKLKKHRKSKSPPRSRSSSSSSSISDEEPTNKKHKDKSNKWKAILRKSSGGKLKMLQHSSGKKGFDLYEGKKTPEESPTGSFVGGHEYDVGLGVGPVGVGAGVGLPLPLVAVGANRCLVCGDLATFRCVSCFGSHYCGPEHQAAYKKQWGYICPNGLGAAMAFGIY